MDIDASALPQHPHSARADSDGISSAPEAGSPRSSENSPTSPDGHPESVEPGVLLGADAPSPLIIVMHASVGSGHRSAANAVAQAFELLRDGSDETLDGSLVATGIDRAAASDPACASALSSHAPENEARETMGSACTPHDFDVEVIDVLDFGRIVFDGNKAASLFTGATRPIYDLTWRFSLTGRLLWGGGTAWNRIMYPAFTDYVREKRPAAIVCTHITAANVATAARMLTGQRFPIVCVPTDYETEGLWPHRSADLFCVANESMAETLRPRRVPEERILITGIPTRDDFRRSYDKRATREKMNLPQNKRVVLALAGAYLPRPYVHFREAIDRTLPYLHSLDDSTHVVIVAGSDAEYARHLRQACAELGVGNATVLDYVDEMAALMAASDLVICKSGGLTVTECLCAQVPMILLGKAYGQEKVNVRMLTSVGAAMHVTTARELVDALRHIAANPESVHAMLVNGSFLRRPDAALDIARATLCLARTPMADDAHYRKHFLQFYWGRKPAHIR